MELIGWLIFADGCYWVCNDAEGWACPFGVGDGVEVLVGGQWQSVTMQSGGYRASQRQSTDDQHQQSKDGAELAFPHPAR